jgi:formate dehydrogenase subunit gamma
MPEGAEAASTARAICARHGNDPAALIEILHDLQDIEGFVPEAALPVIAEALNIGKAEVHGVVSFYHDFRNAPAGRVVVKLCRAEACQSMGASALIDRILARHGAALGETDRRGVTVEAVYCLGNCALAPAAMVGRRLVGRVSEARLDAAIAEALA